MATTDSKTGVGSVVELDSVRARSTHVLRSANLTPHPRQIERLAAAANPPATASTLDGETSLRNKNASGTSNTIPVPAGAPA